MLKSVKYWQGLPSDEEAIMGGFQALSPVDERDSRKVLGQLLLRQEGPEFALVADIGAGIGRVTERVLLRFAKQVHLFEPVEASLEAARGRLAVTRRCEFYQDTIQAWRPRADHYDVVWIQFAIIYTTDRECLDFLRTAAQAVKPSGYVVVKDNMPEGGADDETVDDLEDTTAASDEPDADDGSVIRSRSRLIALARLAGLQLLHSFPQPDWPPYLYSVSTLVFRAS